MDLKKRAYLIGFAGPEKRSLDELADLLSILNYTVIGTHVQKRDRPNARFFFGKGKLLEIAKYPVDTLVIDSEVSPSQQNNIAELTNLEVLDRCQIILEIFAAMAKTKEAKIQVEISRLEYLMPRLKGHWEHFSRQKGGIGLKGEGEQQIEIDRRILKDKLKRLKKSLADIRKTRKVQSKNRVKNFNLVAAIGYTNVGKSSIINGLCNSNLLVEDKFFATLDASYRMLSPESKPPIVMIDTVGFISNLPTVLISGFKSTLEAVKDADLLLIVLDLNSNFHQEMEETEKILRLLEVSHKNRLIVLNKRDLISTTKQKIISSKMRGCLTVSSLKKRDMVNLRQRIIDYFLDELSTFDIFVGYDQGQMHSLIKRHANIIKTKNHRNGIFYRIKLAEYLFYKLSLDKFNLKSNRFGNR